MAKFLRLTAVLACGLSLGVGGASACGGSSGGDVCGEGTVEADGICSLPPDAGPASNAVRCGAGTHLDGTACVSNQFAPPIDAAQTDSGELDYRTACIGTTNRLFAVGQVGAYLIGPKGVDILGGTTWHSLVLRRQSEQLPSYVVFETGQDGWTLTLSTNKIPTALNVGDYPNVHRAELTETSGPGISLEGDSRGCNKVSGEFDILQSGLIAGDGSLSEVLSLTATFVIYCEEKPIAVYGCIHYEQ